MKLPESLLFDQPLVLGVGTLIAAPISTKNAHGECDSEMKQTNEGNQWYSCMKAHMGADGRLGLVRNVVGTAANVNHMTQAGSLLHRRKYEAWGNAGYQGVHKRAEAAGPK